MQVQLMLHACACRHTAHLLHSQQQLEAQVLQLTADLQRSSQLLSCSEEDLQHMTEQQQTAQQQLSRCMERLAATEQTVQLESNRQQQQSSSCPQVAFGQHSQLQQSNDVAAAAELSQHGAGKAAEAQQELEMLRGQLHDSVELLEEADRQLRQKAAEADDYKASLQAAQQELHLTQSQLQETQAVLEEHADLLQQHNVQLLQAQEELQACESRCTPHLLPPPTSTPHTHVLMSCGIAFLKARNGVVRLCHAIACWLRCLNVCDLAKSCM